ncbi:PH domain-containing protein [Mucilaginibacter glaciei]|uniref:PH domain-containing protein n=1 Tax=Mucilaginibacter glaciei TaxID=2772109 RepID=A0A926NTM3_9SPHI|nr:PH domain-containing protein [Mucilaginibacter glaciei]MBD1391534.1 PH domain-containing protein [Mucilaginibacter glaciei]
MKYYSRKGSIVIAIIVFVVIMTIICFFAKVYAASYVLITALMYLAWMWYDTYYIIRGNQLFYKSALLKGSIEINAIVEIVKNKKLFSGKKPSLSTKGIIINYNKYDDIFISPKKIDQFIKALKTINPNIKVTD